MSTRHARRAPSALLLAIRAARQPRAWHALAFLPFAFVVLSCGGGGTGPAGPSGGNGGGGGPTPPVTSAPVVASVAVSPTPVALAVGGTQQLAATPRDASGNAISGRTVTWTSSNAAIATVVNGMVTAVAGGSAIITATCDGIGGTVTVTVASAPSVTSVATVVVTPTTLTLPAAGTGRLTATTRDAAGATLTGRVVTWTSSDANVASVASDGTVTNRAAGTVTITATSEGKTGTAQVTTNGAAAVASFTTTDGTTSVTDQVEAGNVVRFNVVARDSAGTFLANPGIAKVTSDSTVATVTLGGAETIPEVTISTRKVGTATITLTCAGKTIVVNMVVIAASASISVSPSPLTLAAGESRQLVATVKDSAGNVLTRQVQFLSGNPAVATVNGSTGMVTGMKADTTTITASVNGKATHVRVTVLPPAPVATIALTPSSFMLRPGTTQQLTATLRDANGALLTGRTVTWTSSAPSIATVSGAGFVTGVVLGSATITATSEGKTATAILTVVAPVASITIEPTTAVMHVNDNLPLVVTVRDAAGNALTGRQVGLTSSAPSIVQADTAGGFLATALALGTVTVTAAAEGKTASMTIRVLPPPTVTTVTIRPASVRLYAATSTRVQIYAYDSAGNGLGGRAMSFTTGSSAIATASQANAFEATIVGVAAGTTTFTATVEGKSASIPVVVDPAQVLGTVRVSPTSLSLVIGATDAITATQLDTKGAAMAPSHPVTWSSSNSGIVSVNTSGTVRGIASGTATITATVDGKSASATVTVTAAPPVSGGPGGGGGGGGSTCAFLYTVGGLAPGQSSQKGTPSFPGGIDIVVKAGTKNTGTASAPRYQYTVTVTNRYVQAITASYALGTSQPASGTDRVTTPANSTASFGLSFLPPNTTLYLLIERVSFGTSTAYYCQ